MSARPRNRWLICRGTESSSPLSSSEESANDRFRCVEIDGERACAREVLKGMIPDERERAALCVAAENVAGVKAVHDRLVWVDTVAGIVIPRP